MMKTANSERSTAEDNTAGNHRPAGDKGSTAGKTGFLFLLLCAVNFCEATILTGCAFGQSTPYHYTIQADLPTQLIYCVDQDNAGRLLIGTDKGLYRYNGFRCKRIEMSGNYSREITQLVKVGDYFLAANRSGQLLKLQGDHLNAVSLNGFAGDIRHISVDGSAVEIIGSKYITTYRLPGFTWVGQEAIPYTENAGTVANFVMKFRSERYAVLNSGELVGIEDGESRYIPSSTGKQLIEFNGELVIIPTYTANDPIYTYLNGRFRNWGTMISKPNLKVNGAKVIGTTLYILTENGVFVYKDKLSRKPSHWFRGVATTDILQDIQGNTWICSKGRGLMFIPAGRHDIVCDRSFLSIERGPKGTFFGGNLDGSITQFDERGRMLRTFSSSINSQEALTLHYERNSGLLFSNTGLFSLASGRALNRVNESVKGVVRTNDGRLYFAKSSGVITTTYKRNAALYGMDSSRFAVLRREAGRQVVLNENGQDVAFSTVKGLFVTRSGEDVNEITYQGKAIDAQSIVWFGNDLVIATMDNLLLLARDGRIIKRKDMSVRVGELVVLKMLATNTHVYLLSEKGMYRFARFDDKLESLKELIGFDGLVMRDFAIANDQLYIATQRGVLRFSWKQEQKIGYTLVVSEVTGRKYKKYGKRKDRIQFPHDEKLIIVPFECVDLSGNQQFVIQYAIHTSNERGVWNALPASADQLNLSHLNPGDYTVEFYLYDPLSQTKSEIQRTYFTVQYAWYNRPYLWWFIVVFLLGGIGLTWKWTLKRQREKLKAEFASLAGK